MIVAKMLFANEVIKLSIKLFKKYEMNPFRLRKSRHPRHFKPLPDVSERSRRFPDDSGLACGFPKDGIEKKKMRKSRMREFSRFINIK
jgi:hypothetical protein